MSDNSVWVEIIKTLLKPGYLYGIGEDGELYAVEIDKLPKEHDTVIIRYASPINGNSALGDGNG